MAAMSVRRFGTLSAPVAVVVLLLLASRSDAGAVTPLRDPVTYMGQTMLARSDLVARGAAPADLCKVGLGAYFMVFEVDEVLYGRDGVRRVQLIGSDPSEFPLPKQPCVLFLRHLDGARYEPTGIVDTTGAEGAVRLKALKSYIGIEETRGPRAKRRALHDLLMKNLRSGDRFLRWSAARELAHFTEKNGRYFSRKDLKEMRARSAQGESPVFRDLLHSAVTQIAHSLGESGKPRHADHSTAKDLGTGPPGYARLCSAYLAPGASAQHRLAALRELCTKFLRYAGPALIKALGDPSAKVRELAAYQLGQGEVDAAKKPLTDLLANESSKKVLSAAVRSLGILGARKALPEILDLGKDPDMLRTVALAAGRIGGKRARDWLLALRSMHSGASKADRDIRNLVDFIESPAFARQEKLLKKIRDRKVR